MAMAQPLTGGLTLGRAREIEDGRGAPASPEELLAFAEFQEKANAFAQAIAPMIRRAAKAYPKAVRVINAAPKAERERLSKIPLVVVAAMCTRRADRPMRSGARVRSRRVRTARRARSPGRKSSGPDGPHHRHLTTSSRGFGRAVSRALRVSGTEHV